MDCPLLNVLQDRISTVFGALVQHAEILERLRLTFDAAKTLTENKYLHYFLHFRSCWVTRQRMCWNTDGAGCIATELMIYSIDCPTIT